MKGMEGRGGEMGRDERRGGVGWGILEDNGEIQEMNRAEKEGVKIGDLKA